MTVLGQQINLQSILLVAILVLAIQAFFGGRSQTRSWKSLSEQLLSANDSLQRITDEQGRETARMTSLVLEANKQLEQQASEIEEIKRLASKTVVETNTVFQPFEVPVTNTVELHHTDTVHVASFVFVDDWLTMRAKLLEDRVSFQILEVRNKLNIEVGTTRPGFLKKKEYTAFVQNENPYTSTAQIESLVFKENPRWYETTGAKIGVGIIGGFILANQLRK